MKEQLVQVIDKKDLQVLILTDGYNIHHLSGYRGHTGMLVAFQGEQYILTDSRYTEQVELEAPEFTCVDIGREGYSKTIAAMVQKAFAKEGRSTLRIGFENKEISYMQYQAFVDTFAKELTGMQVEFVPLEDAVSTAVHVTLRPVDFIGRLGESRCCRLEQRARRRGSADGRQGAEGTCRLDEHATVYVHVWHFILPSYRFP